MREEEEKEYIGACSIERMTSYHEPMDINNNKERLRGRARIWQIKLNAREYE